jgi:hypothetical protein
MGTLLRHSGAQGQREEGRGETLPETPASKGDGSKEKAEAAKSPGPIREAHSRLEPPPPHVVQRAVGLRNGDILRLIYLRSGRGVVPTHG